MSSVLKIYLPWRLYAGVKHGDRDAFELHGFTRRSSEENLVTVVDPEVAADPLTGRGGAPSPDECAYLGRVVRHLSSKPGGAGPGPAGRGAVEIRVRPTGAVAVTCRWRSITSFIVVVYRPHQTKVPLLRAVQNGPLSALRSAASVLPPCDDCRNKKTGHLHRASSWEISAYSDFGAQALWKWSLHRKFAKLDNHRRKNIMLGTTLDIVLGLCLMWVILYRGEQHRLTRAIYSSAQTVVAMLEGILAWLNGVPAGLKLNKPLNDKLAAFFMYHVYLWRSYIIMFVRPLLGHVTTGVLAVGCCGLSLQLALVNDLLSLFTFHIYCFYVYAARLYFVCVYGLCSLWRLFRGAKWNVLRQRVDSYPYNTDQLFVGTLLFTILLFLLPTVFMYYAVFTSLRLSLMLLKTLNTVLVHIVNTIPLYSFTLRAFSSDETAVDVSFEVISDPKDEVLVLEWKPVQASWSTVFTSCRLTPPSSSKGQPVRTFVWSLVTGDLVSPWPMLPPFETS